MLAGPSPLDPSDEQSLTKPVMVTNPPSPVEELYGVCTHIISTSVNIVIGHLVSGHMTYANLPSTATPYSFRLASRLGCPARGERVDDMKSDSPGPAVERALLTAELRRLRQARGERQQDAAKACEWSVSKFTRIENGTSPITKADLESLLRHYGMTDVTEISELTDRARRARQKGWWEAYGIGDKAFEGYLGYEDGASRIRVSTAVTLPGLLQAPEYTRAILMAYKVPSDAINDAIRLRQERQRRVAERAPTQTFIVDEAALARPAGHAMPDQLRHLIHIAHKPAVTLRVIPIHQGPHFGLKGPFVLLDFDGALDPMLYLESARSGDLLIAGSTEQSSAPGVSVVPDPSGTVAEYEDGYDSLGELALDPADSLKLLEKLARDIK